MKEKNAKFFYPISKDSSAVVELLQLTLHLSFSCIIVSKVKDMFRKRTLESNLMKSDCYLNLSQNLSNSTKISTNTERVMLSTSSLLK